MFVYESMLWKRPTYTKIKDELDEGETRKIPIQVMRITYRQPVTSKTRLCNTYKDKTRQEHETKRGNEAKRGARIKRKEETHQRRCSCTYVFATGEVVNLPLDPVIRSLYGASKVLNTKPTPRMQK